jgi:hypothetical protein
LETYSQKTLIAGTSPTVTRAWCASTPSLSKHLVTIWVLTHIQLN